jgi:hypothetical protein
MSCTEAALHNLGIPLVYCSSTINEVDTHPPGDRLKYITGVRISRVVHDVTKYTLRPALLKDVTFYDFYRHYTPSFKVLTKTSMKKISENPAEYWDDNHPCRVIYHSDEVVAFPAYHPSYHLECFFYDILLQRIPFRTEDYLLSEGNCQKSYFLECILRGIISTDTDLLNLLEAHAERNLRETNDCSKQLAELLRKVSYA